MKCEIFRMQKVIMLGIEFEWDYGSISLYLLFWEFYFELKG